MSESDVGALIAGTVGLICALVSVVIAVILIISMWKIYSKAGQPGWTSLIPIVNLYFLMKVAGRPGWMFILFFIPFVNFVMVILVNLDVAKAFGKSVLFALGMLFLGVIFWPVLAFGKSEYVGRQA